MCRLQRIRFVCRKPSRPRLCRLRSEKPEQICTYERSLQAKARRMQATQHASTPPADVLAQVAKARPTADSKDFVYAVFDTLSGSAKLSRAFETPKQSMRVPGPKAVRQVAKRLDCARVAEICRSCQAPEQRMLPCAAPSVRERWRQRCKSTSESRALMWSQCNHVTGRRIVRLWQPSRTSAHDS